MHGGRAVRETIDPAMSMFGCRTAPEVTEPFIANRDETTAHNIRVAAGRDGRFTVTNTRNGMSKTYQPRRALAARP